MKLCPTNLMRRSSCKKKVTDGINIVKKEINEKKSKLLKNKGLHWNVYYEILALTDVEKNNFKSGNSKFCQDYGVNN